MDSKICKTCGIEKPVSEFSTGGPVHKSGKRSLRAHCKSCRRKPKWERKKDSPLYWKHRFLKTKFGITLKEYQDLYTKQNGVCAICHKPEVVLRLGKLKALAVDHSHTTNKNRGLLCQKCNVGIGHFEDNIDLLLNAIDYLKRYE